MSLTSEQASKQHEAELMDNRKKYAKEKIYNLVRSYPKDTQDEWVVFGYGGVRITLGDLKDLFGVDR
jgi:hypothetical protein